MKTSKSRRETATPVSHHQYPRPQLVRNQWTSLDGTWGFAIDVNGEWTDPNSIEFAAAIEVPFAPETPASGVNNTSFFQACWYRRTIDSPKLADGERLILHFGAVDYQATVWVNGQLVAQHEGGYTPFSADITENLTGKGEQSIIVRAQDDPHDLAKPRGKQDWQLHPHSIWYPRTTGIWQTVWLERVPETYVKQLRWTSDSVKWEIQLDAAITGRQQQGLRLRVRLESRGKVLADDTFSMVGNELSRGIALFDPGIDDYRNEFLWSPHSPNLIDVMIELQDPDGKVIDTVHSYTAMRGAALLGNRFVLNGRPFMLHLVLDQGYWSESGLTAPSDAALRKDVELVKAMGFNGVRKHQKIENPRFLYWADKLGLFVWEEMPSCYRFSTQAIARLTQQWTEAIQRDISHPCIIAWVPINESWGVPDLPQSATQRHAVQALYHLTKTLDPSRPVIGNDGWEAAATDIVGIHDYDANPERIRHRYKFETAAVEHLFRNERPGNKALILEGFEYSGQPIMLTEFGGIAFSKDRVHTWGYSRAETADVFAHQYYTLLDAVRSLPLFAGFCYTQFTDTYQEANGLLYMDRTPKFPLEQIATATRGAHSESERSIEAAWRESLMGFNRK